MSVSIYFNPLTDKNIKLNDYSHFPKNHLMIVAGGVLVQVGIVADISFQFPDFFLQGVDLLVDGFQKGPYLNKSSIVTSDCTIPL